jgi:hydroxyacid-oxoacid transhydrogenase
MSVILNAPAVFRFTGMAQPERHLEAARVLGADVSGASLEDAGEILAQVTIELMRRTNMPNGLAAVGYTEDDIPALVEGTLPQHRVTKLSPRPFTPDDLAGLFRDAMSYW